MDSASRAPTGAARRKVVVAVDFPLSSGDERAIRTANGYAQLARYIDVDVCTLGDEAHEPRVFALAPGMREIRTGSTPALAEPWREGLAALGPDGTCETARWILLPKPPRYVEALRGALAGASLAITCLPWSYALLRRLWDGPIVYHAHAVEGLDHPFSDTRSGRDLARLAASIERRCAREAALLLVASSHDRDLFVERYGLAGRRFVVIPPYVAAHGVRWLSNAERKQMKESTSLRGQTFAVFVAGAARRDVIAVERLCAYAQRLPGIRFVIVGRAFDAFKGRIVPRNVSFTGEVAPQIKWALLQSADVALNPSSAHSGSDLVMIEYALGGAPIVATRQGARGLGWESGREYFEAGDDDFPAAIERAIADTALSERLTRNAYADVTREQEWERIACELFSPEAGV